MVEKNPIVEDRRSPLLLSISISGFIASQQKYLTHRFYCSLPPGIFCLLEIPNAGTAEASKP
jgi:hypothetical protein